MKRRIVSLVPSLTELLVEIGLRNEIVGCTQFCVSPPGLHRGAEIIGGTKDPNIDQVRSLRPTHIIANEEENRKDDVESLQKVAPTLVTFPTRPKDVPQMISDIGQFLDHETACSELAKQIESNIANLGKASFSDKKFLYLIWRDPYMAVGRDTYISRCLELIGLENAYEGNERYPTVDVGYMSRAKPDIVFLSSEPFAFRKRHAHILRNEGIGTDVAIAKIDGKLLSWYGSTTLEFLNQAANYAEGKADIWQVVGED